MTSLTAGSMMGAGALTMPAACYKGGFFPSAAVTIVYWLLLLLTALLLAEVYVNVLFTTGKTAVSFNTIYFLTLGKAATLAIGVASTVMAFAGVAAFMDMGGGLIRMYLPDGFPAPLRTSPLLFAGAIYATITAFTEDHVNAANNYVVALCLGSFLAVLLLGAPTVDPAALLPMELLQTFPSQSGILLSALGFHNVVPTVCYHLGGDLRLVTTALAVGSGVPLIFYLAWLLVAIGNVPRADVTTAGGSLLDFVDPLRIILGRAGGTLHGRAFQASVAVFMALSVVSTLVAFLYGLARAVLDALDAPPPLSPQRYRQIMRIRSFNDERVGLHNAARYVQRCWRRRSTRMQAKARTLAEEHNLAMKAKLAKMHVVRDAVGQRTLATKTQLATKAHAVQGAAARTDGGSGGGGWEQKDDAAGATEAAARRRSRSALLGERGGPPACGRQRTWSEVVLESVMGVDLDAVSRVERQQRRRSSEPVLSINDRATAEELGRERPLSTLMYRRLETTSIHELPAELQQRMVVHKRRGQEAAEALAGAQPPSEARTIEDGGHQSGDDVEGGGDEFLDRARSVPPEPSTPRPFRFAVVESQPPSSSPARSRRMSLSLMNALAAPVARRKSLLAPGAGVGVSLMNMREPISLSRHGTVTTVSSKSSCGSSSTISVSSTPASSTGQQPTKAHGDLPPAMSLRDYGSAIIDGLRPAASLRSSRSAVSVTDPVTPVSRINHASHNRFASHDSRAAYAGDATPSWQRVSHGGDAQGGRVGGGAAASSAFSRLVVPLHPPPLDEMGESRCEVAHAADADGISRLTMMKLGVPLIWLPCMVAVVWPGSYFAVLRSTAAYGAVLTMIVCPAASAWAQRFGRRRTSLNKKAMMVNVPCARLVLATLLLWGYGLWAYSLLEDFGPAVSGVLAAVVSEGAAA